jgi:TrmH family RNA methyltransferase
MAAPLRIESRSNPLLVRLRKLARDPAAYRTQRQIVIEGEHLCDAWIARRGEAPMQAVVSEAGWHRTGVRELAARAAAVAIVSEAAMDGLTALETPAPLVFVVPLPEPAPLRPADPAVVLDGVQDPGNVGSILRSAAAFGFGQVVALAGTAALWSPKVVRAGMGAHFGLHLVESATVASLEAFTIPILGTSSHAGERIDDAVLPWPCAWAFGHEGQGLSADVAARCARMLRIAQPGGEESLNVAAAAAVCFHESARRASAIR